MQPTIAPTGIIKFFLLPIIFTALALLGSFAYGYIAERTLAAAINNLTITAILGIMELSLSFDNAIVNARKLRDMSPVWQLRFMTWGMFIAVFGMRFAFPVIIVSIFGHVTPWAAIYMALFNPDEYARTLTAADPMISAFGGNFLLMVALSFFFDPSGEKDTHWIAPIERAMSAFGAKADTLGIVALVLGIDAMVAAHIGVAGGFSFFCSAIAGIIAFALVEILSGALEEEEEEEQSDAETTASDEATIITADALDPSMVQATPDADAPAKRPVSVTRVVGQAGFGAFLYLEVQDASFSFDGVIGAFALSHLLIVITLGLLIGAAFVRGMTLLLVERNTLGTNVYLEHGAFWAILFMAMVMEFKPYGELPNIAVGLTSALLLILAFVSSRRHAARERAQVQA